MAEQAKYYPPDVEQIETVRVLDQAWRMRGLAKNYGGLLGNTRPGFVARYGRYPSAVKNLFQLAEDPNISGFLLYLGADDNETPVGAGTVIWNRHLEVRPSNGGRPWSDTFTDIDYWVGSPLHDDAHREIGKVLVEHAVTADPANPAIVSSLIGRDFPVGLDTRNGFDDSAIANPVSLIATDGDPYGVTRQGAPVNIRIRLASAQ